MYCSTPQLFRKTLQYDLHTERHVECSLLFHFLCEAPQLLPHLARGLQTILMKIRFSIYCGFIISCSIGPAMLLCSKPLKSHIYHLPAMYSINVVIHPSDPVYGPKPHHAQFF